MLMTKELKKSKKFGWRNSKVLAFIFCFCFRILVFLLPLFNAISLRFLDLCEGSPARPLVVCPPRIAGSGRPVHGPLHVTEKWFPLLTGAVASPPVLTIIVHFIVEAVINLAWTHQRRKQSTHWMQMNETTKMGADILNDKVQEWNWRWGLYPSPLKWAQTHTHTQKKVLHYKLCRLSMLLVTTQRLW